MAGRGDGRERIERLLDPDSIAIAGASADPNKRGYTALERLKNSQYAGSIHPVNHSYEGASLGEPVFDSVADIPATVDLVDAPVELRPGGTSRVRLRYVDDDGPTVRIDRVG
jgi:acetyltransferase